MTTKCQLIKDAIDDEKKAALFYEKLGKKLHGKPKEKISEIRKEETVHRKELIEILEDSICHIR
jgi:rubrerythrin